MWIIIKTRLANKVAYLKYILNKFKQLYFIHTNNPLRNALRGCVTPQETDEILNRPPRIGGYLPESKDEFIKAYEKRFNSSYPQ